jgi:hypothetical protein
MNHQYLDVLRELAFLQTDQIPLNESVIWQRILERTKSCAHDDWREILNQASATLNDRYGGLLLPHNFRHGDFAPWNVKLADDKLLIYDWEYAESEAPPGWDLFHFLFQTLRLLGNQSIWTIWREFFDNGSAKRWLIRHFKNIGISREFIYPLFLFYLLDRLSLIVSIKSPGLESPHDLFMIFRLALSKETLT